MHNYLAELSVPVTYESMLSEQFKIRSMRFEAKFAT